MGRPRKRWEDDINQFLKSEETEATKSNDFKNNDTWIWQRKAQKGKTWKTIMSRDTKHNGSRRQQAPAYSTDATDERDRDDYDTDEVEYDAFVVEVTKMERKKHLCLKSSNHGCKEPATLFPDIPSESDDSRVRFQRRQILCLTSRSSL